MTDVWTGAGKFVKAGGPTTLAVLALILAGYVILRPEARADSFTGTDAKHMSTAIYTKIAELERRVQEADASLKESLASLADAMAQHSASSHLGTSTSLAEIRADLRNIKETQARILQKLDSR